MKIKKIICCLMSIIIILNMEISIMATDASANTEEQTTDCQEINNQDIKNEDNEELRNIDDIAENKTGDEEYDSLKDDISDDDILDFDETDSVLAAGNDVGNNSITYRKYNDIRNKFVTEAIDDYTLVTSDNTEWGIEGVETWYVLNPELSEVLIDGRIKVKGTVNLVLCDNKVLTAKKGISVNEGNSLRIYAQSSQGLMGKIVAGIHGSSDGAYAGIGGDESYSAGEIAIYGGIITSYGGSTDERNVIENIYPENEYYYYSSGAGIGGGANGNGGIISIYGGQIDTYAGMLKDYSMNNKYYGAGIGGGSHGDGGNIFINGGKINVVYFDGAGIGGGANGNGGTITINGGEIYAISENYSPALLDGLGAGIGGGANGNGGTITINDGYIYSSSIMGAAIGSGSYSNRGMVVVNGGVVNVASYFGAGIGTGRGASGLQYDISTTSYFQTIINGGIIKVNIGKENARSYGYGIRGAGIGGGEYVDGGIIRINGGEIEAYSNDGAGIGGGQYGNGGRIIIYGGDVKTESETATGIGGGKNSSSGDIAIYGGNIEAIGGNTGNVASAGIGNSGYYSNEYSYSSSMSKGSINIYSGVIKASVAEGADNIAECLGKGSGNQDYYAPLICFKNGTRDVTSKKDDYFYDITTKNTRTIKKICHISVEKNAEAIVSIDNEESLCYDIVTLTVNHDADLNKLMVECGDETIMLTKVDDNKYTFVTPDNDVHISYKGFTATVSMEDWTYGEVSKQPILGENSNPGNGDVLFEYYIDDNCKIKTTPKNSGSEFIGGCPKEAGTYFIKATIAETTDYAEVSATASFTITKANSAPDMPRDNIIVDSDVNKLSDIVLPDNWAWKEDKLLSMAETTTAIAVYKGTDIGNYENESIEIGIYRICDHSFRIVKNKQTPTCTQKGYSGDVYCSLCDKFLLGGSSIVATGHSWSEWKETKPATTTSNGELKRVCENCNEIETKEIPKIGNQSQETPISDKTEPTPIVPEPSSPDAGFVDMYRLYNPNSGEHFYTSNAGERDYLVSVGWSSEGIGWKAPTTSNTPVYRLYNPNAGDHHYTMNKAERDNLISVGWNDEGIGWYSDDEQGVPLYRQYNPNAVTGSHNYTTNKSENDWLISVGWNGEGIGWYGVK